MTNKEILKKVIKKAGKNVQLLSFDCNKSNEELLIFNYIFSHEFAKAFWGEERQYIQDDECDNAEDLINNEYKWQYHLQQMILEEEPLKYLKEFL